jgi:putative hydrolase of the HAD superfamily
MTAKRFLIWDFDGTLAFRSGGWTSALLDVLRQNAPGLLITPEQVRPFLASGFPWHAPENIHPGLSADEWWEDLLPLFVRAFRGIGVESTAAHRYAAQVRAAYLDLSAWQIFSDTLPALESLTRRGWTHGLFTNHVPELPLLLDHFCLSKRFAITYNSAATGIEKPNQKAFRAVLESIGGCAAWMIGDSYTADILGAAEAGMPAILVRKTHPGAKWCCGGLAEIEGIVG